MISTYQSFQPNEGFISLGDLDLKDICLSDEGMESYFNESMSEICPIGKLNISLNNITTKGVRFLNNILINNTKFRHLHSLNLSGNDLGCEGAVIIATTLKARQITVLKLSNCNIKLKGIKALSESLKNSPLQKLDLSINPLTDLGVVSLCEALIGSDTLVELDLEECELGDRENEGILSIAKLLAKSQSLESLNLAGNSIEDSQVLIVALKVNTSLRILNLNNTNIDDVSLNNLCYDLFIEEAYYRRSLQLLTLNNTDITSDSLELVDQLIEEGHPCNFRYSIAPCFGFDFASLQINYLFLTDEEQAEFTELSESVCPKGIEINEITEEISADLVRIKEMSTQDVITLLKNTQNSLQSSDEVLHMKELTVIRVPLFFSSEGQKLLQLLPASLTKLNLLNCGIT